MKTTGEVKVTFRPLSRKRFRCNQKPGVIVKQGNIKRRRRSLENELKPHGSVPRFESNSQTIFRNQPVPSTQNISINFWGKWVCTCGMENIDRYASVNSTISCIRCQRKGRVISNDF